MIGEAAARALARRQGAELRVRAVATELALGGGEIRAANEEGARAAQAAQARANGDPRLALLQALRRTGMTLAAALAEVERRSRDPASVGPAGFGPAANGLKSHAAPTSS